MIERYTRPDMGALWTLRRRFEAWLEVELAVCEAWTRLGVISAADMAVIEPTEAGLVLREVASGVTVDQVVAATSARLILPEIVATMPV